MYSYRQEYKSKALRRKYIVEFYGLVFVTQSKGESKLPLQRWRALHVWLHR
mgnify:CR=1 FL=1